MLGDIFTIQDDYNANIKSANITRTLQNDVEPNDVGTAQTFEIFERHNECYNAIAK